MYLYISTHQLGGMDQLKKPPDKQQDSAVSVPQPSTEGTKRATTRRRSRENNRKQQEEQDAQEQVCLCL